MRPIREGQTTFARGLNDTAAPEEYLADEVALLFNGRVSFDGMSIERRDGSRKLHSSALDGGSRGWGGIDFQTASGTKQRCAFVGDKFYTSTDNGVTWTQQASGLRTDRWSIALMRDGADNKLLAANGSSSIYYWDGATWGTLSGAPTGVKYLSVFNGRLYAAGHDGINIEASKVGDPNTWTLPDGLLVQLQTHDSDEEIRGLYQLGDILLAWKEQSTNLIEGYGFRTLQVEAGARGLSRSVGLAGTDTIRAIGDQGVAWLSERGIEFYRFGGQGIKLVTEPIQEFVEGLSWSNILSDPTIPTACYWPRKREYWCAVPGTGAINDHIIVFRPGEQRQPAAVWVFKYSGAVSGDTAYVDPNTGYLTVQGDTSKNQVDLVKGYLKVLTGSQPGYYVDVNSTTGYLETLVPEATPAQLFMVHRDDSPSEVMQPWMIGEDGYVRVLEDGNTDDQDKDGTGGSAINLRMRPRPFIFGDQVRRKRGRTIRVSAASPDGTADLDIFLQADDSPGNTHTKQFQQSDKPTTEKVRTNGRGYTLQVEVSTEDKVKIRAVELIAERLQEAL